jgi:uncharacterized protein (DUF4415 family)
MKNNSTTDLWVDEDDAPLLSEIFFENAVYKENGVEMSNPFKTKGRPKSLTPKQAINIRLSQDVIEYFKSTGKGWQSRIDSTLLDFIKNPNFRQH